MGNIGLAGGYGAASVGASIEDMVKQRILARYAGERQVWGFRGLVQGAL